MYTTKTTFSFTLSFSFHFHFGGIKCVTIFDNSQHMYVYTDCMACCDLKKINSKILISKWKWIFKRFHRIPCFSVSERGWNGDAVDGDWRVNIALKNRLQLAANDFDLPQHSIHCPLWGHHSRDYLLNHNWSISVSYLEEREENSVRYFSSTV